MFVYKAKVEKTVPQREVEIKSPYGAGYALRLQAFYYDGESPSKYLHLLDADKDEFMFPIPGQARPNASTPELPTTVKLPLYYYDEAGEKTLILWGEVEKIDRKTTSL